MGEIEWSSELETGIELMDQQHQRLVEIYNELNAALMVGKAHKKMNDILGALIEYTEHHFDDEEKLMEEAGYTDLNQHKNEHQQLILKIKRFKKKLDADTERISKPVMKFLEFWLTKHIRGSDTDFVDWKKMNCGTAVDGEGAEAEVTEETAAV